MAALTFHRKVIADRKIFPSQIVNPKYHQIILCMVIPTAENQTHKHIKKTAKNILRSMD